MSHGGKSTYVAWPIFLPCGFGGMDKYPLNDRNIYHADDLGELIQKTRARHDHDDPAIGENFKIMKIDYEFAYKRDPKGDHSPSSIVIDNITERYTWDEALKEYDSALDDASSVSLPSPPDDRENAMPSVRLITSTTMPWMVAQQGSLNADPEHATGLSR